MSGPSAKPDTEKIMLVRDSRHSLVEDVFAITIGVMLVSFGVFLFQQANLVIGGVAGISLVASYATGLEFPILFFLINLPFYIFAIGKMGWRFIIKTFCAVGLMSVVMAWLPSSIVLASAHPAVAGAFGGTMIGLGLLALFRHGAGLGGITILVFWLQSEKGLRAGYVQLAIDGVILISAVTVIGWERAIWSVLGAVLFNLILAINHKPGRYMGVS